MSDLLKSVLELFRSDGIVNDNIIFRMNYKATTVILSAFMITATTARLLNSPIDCQSDPESSVSMNTYCWAQSKFILPPNQPNNMSQSPTLEEPIDYAQWMYFQVWFTLQALFLYCPHYVWMTIAHSTLTRLTSELNSLTLQPERKQELKKLAVDYFKNNNNIKSNCTYLSRWLLACEIANFFHMLLELTYSEIWIGCGFQFTCAEDIIEKIFPLAAVCKWDHWSTEGMVKAMGLCVLPLNAVNRLIFNLRRAWFQTLAVLSCFAVLYRITMIYSKEARKNRLEAQAPQAPKEKIKSVALHYPYCVLTILIMFGKNVHPSILEEIIEELAAGLKPDSPRKRRRSNGPAESSVTQPAASV